MDQAALTSGTREVDVKDSRERFAATADDYQRYRPSYPAAVLDWIVTTTGVTPPARVADVGAGTGIFTRLLAARGFDVVGVEPNPAMRELATARGGPRYQAGEATRTGLPDASLALITAAQAFHWFELGPTLAEWQRVLAPGGWAVALWNLRVPSPFNDAYEALLLARSSDYGALNDLRDPRGPGGIRYELHWHDHLPSWEAVLGRVSSASYVVHGVADRPAFEAELRALYDRHSVDGGIDWHMRVVAAAWPRS
jgi:SAM-dependent methyltransferase